MGIVKGIFGTRISGKVGNVVFRTRGGTNVVSEKASSVKNPRSNAQQFQRMCMATCSAAYAGLKTICDHSFEGVGYGADSMSYFMKMNLPALRAGLDDDVFVAYNAKGNNTPYANDLLISKGSLPSVSYNVTDADDTNHICNLNLSPFNNNLAAAITVGQFHQDVGIQIGDQITFIAMGLTNSVVSSDYVTQNGACVVTVRLIFNAGSEELPLFSETSINTAALDMDKSSNVNAISYVTNLKCFTFAGIKGTVSLPGAAVIISRKNGSSWLRSTQRLAVVPINNSTTKAEVEQNYGRDVVLPSYLPTGEKYLNNANV